MTVSGLDINWNISALNKQFSFSSQTEQVKARHLKNNHDFKVALTFCSTPRLPKILSIAARNVLISAALKKSE